MKKLYTVNVDFEITHDPDYLALKRDNNKSLRMSYGCDTTDMKDEKKSISRTYHVEAVDVKEAEKLVLEVINDEKKMFTDHIDKINSRFDNPIFKPSILPFDYDPVRVHTFEMKKVIGRENKIS